jgi:hypothetical protein
LKRNEARSALSAGRREIACWIAAAGTSTERRRAPSRSFFQRAILAEDSSILA